jgi:hypothetical protein
MSNREIHQMLRRCWQDCYERNDFDACRIFDAAVRRVFGIGR